MSWIWRGLFLRTFLKNKLEKKLWKILVNEAQFFCTSLQHSSESNGEKSEAELSPENAQAVRRPSLLRLTLKSILRTQTSPAPCRGPAFRPVLNKQGISRVHIQTFCSLVTTEYVARVTHTALRAGSSALTGWGKGTGRLARGDAGVVVAVGWAIESWKRKVFPIILV